MCERARTTGRPCQRSHNILQKIGLNARLQMGHPLQQHTMLATMPTRFLTATLCNPVNQGSEILARECRQIYPLQLTSRTSNPILPTICCIFILPLLILFLTLKKTKNHLHVLTRSCDYVRAHYVCASRRRCACLGVENL